MDEALQQNRTFPLTAGSYHAPIGVNFEMRPELPPRRVVFLMTFDVSCIVKSARCTRGNQRSGRPPLGHVLFPNQAGTGGRTVVQEATLHAHRLGGHAAHGGACEEHGHRSGFRGDDNCSQEHTTATLEYSSGGDLSVCRPDRRIQYSIQ